MNVWLAAHAVSKGEGVPGAGYNRRRMAVAAPRTRTQEADAGGERAGAASWHWLLLPLAVGGTLALQLTTITYYYYFDDYVPFGEMAAESRWEYIWRLFTSTDLTPNWRPLPGLLYLGSWEIAGMNPLPVRIFMIAMHAGTAALIYYVLWRTTRRAWAACAGALVFGLNPAYVGALSQVTTATQVMAGFFLMATLVAAIETAISDDRRRANAWLAAAVVLWVAALASHEGMAIMFPAFGLALYTFDRERSGRLRRAAARTAPFAAIGFATAGAFAACGCNEGSSVWGADYAWNQTSIYLGRLLYPVGLELPTQPGLAHMAAAAALIAIMLAASAFAPKIARVGSLWALLAVAPHVFIQYFTASRYLYLPTPGYALLFASVAVMLVDRLSRVDLRVVSAAGVASFAALFGWYAYQTVRQDEHFANATADWRRFHRDVTRVFPRVPPGTRVMIIGGPFQKYEYQIHILPSFAQATWGGGVTLTDMEPGSLPARLALISDSPYVAEYRDGQLVRVHDGDIVR